MSLRRLPDSRFSIIERAWEGATCVLIAGGPSLTQAQVDQVRAAHDVGAVKCISINDAYLWADFADVNYFADASWFVDQMKGVAKPLLKLSADQVREKFAAFKGAKCSMQSSQPYITDDAVHMVRNKHWPIHGYGLSSDPECLGTGRHSGFQALNMAILAGAKTILLLGYDGQKAKDGKTHWFGDHAKPEPDDIYAMFKQSFLEAAVDIKATGVRVIQCSPCSAIDNFKTMGLEAALAEVLQPVAA